MAPKSVLVSYLFALLALSTYLVQAHDGEEEVSAGRMGRGKSETEDNEFKLLEAAYKRLIALKGPNAQMALHDLHEINPSDTSPDRNVPIDLRKLMAISKPTGEDCRRDYVLRLRHLKVVKLTSEDLHRHLREALKKQLDLRLEEAIQLVTAFKLAYPYSWTLIKEYSSTAIEFGFKGGKFLGQVAPMNLALTGLLVNKIEEGSYKEGSSICEVVCDLTEGCYKFSSKLGPSLRLAAMHSRIKSHKNVLNWLNYASLCAQVDEMNFQGVIIDIFKKYRLPAVKKCLRKYNSQRQQHA